MPASEFSALQARLSDASFPQDQVKLIQRIPRTTELSCQQTVQLLKEFSFSKDQITVIEHLTPQISDLTNRHLIIGLLTFSGDKKRAGEILDVAYAAEQEAQHAQAKRDKEADEAKEAQAAQEAKQAKAVEKALADREAKEALAFQALSHRKQAKHLREWAKRLKAKEARLNQREQALDTREARLRKVRNKVKRKGNPPRTQWLSWVGYCPMGIDPKGVTEGQCAPFDADNFNPKRKRGQQLMMQVAQPGAVTFKIESGPKMKRCKAIGNRTSLTQQTIKTTRRNQVIDVSEMIDTWNVDYVRITAQSKGQKVHTAIDDWQRCNR
jgi:hypothetical protein